MEQRKPEGDDRALILVVDDVADNRELYAEYLEFVGYRVAMAADGHEALAKASVNLSASQATALNGMTLGQQMSTLAQCGYLTNQSVANNGTNTAVDPRQNAVMQAKTFADAIPITGLVVTKLDGTAKGGIVLAVHEALDVPVKFIGMGEKVTDLVEFDPAEFVREVLEG